MKTLKFNFNIPEELKVGVSRLSAVLGYEMGEGITVNAIM